MNLRKTLAMLLVFCFVFTLLPLGAPALAADDPDEPEQQLITGTFGDGFEYEFDPVTGTLTVTGKGALQFAKAADIPWTDFRSDIKKIVLGEGITVLGKGVFANCTSLAQIEFPDTIIDVNHKAFEGCGKHIDYLVSDNARARLATILEKNNVLELLEGDVEVAEVLVGAAAAAVTGTYLAADAQSVQKEAAATGNQSQDVIMQGPIDTVTTTEGNTVTITEKVPLYALNRENPPLGNSVRTIVTNPDGSKTITQIITSIGNDDYHSEAHEEVDASGRTTVRTEVATNKFGPPENRMTNTVTSKFVNQYNEDGTGITFQETIFGMSGGRMIGAAYLDAQGRRSSETMYTYQPVMDSEGNVVNDDAGNPVVVLSQVKRSTNNYETGKSLNYYYAPKEGVTPKAPTEMIFDPEEYPFDENDYYPIPEPGPRPSSNEENQENPETTENTESTDSSEPNATPNSAPKMMMAQTGAPEVEEELADAPETDETDETLDDSNLPVEDNSDPVDQPDDNTPADPADDPQNPDDGNGNQQPADPEDETPDNVTPPATDPVTPPSTDDNDDPAGDPPTTGDNAAGGDDNSVPGNTQPSGDQDTTPPANNTPDNDPPVDTPEEGTDPLPESGTPTGE